MFPPRCAARFEPTTLLGSGGFGEVYLARQVDLDRQVVVKLLRSDALREPSQKERFHAEALITASLAHPHIVVVLDHDADDATPWIAYEYVAGPSLGEVLASSPLSWRDAVRTGRQIASALAAAHDRGILHRDIKPDNVLLRSADHVKVADFGIAKWNDRDAPRTQTGIILGSPAYLAPEVIAGGPVTGQSDQYALGILLYQTLCGRLPFAGESVFAVLKAHLDDAVPPLGERADGVPPVVERLVGRLLSKSPQERFPDAHALHDALSSVEGGQDITATQRAPRPRHAAITVVAAPARAVAPRTRHQRMGAFASGLALLLISLATIEWSPPLRERGHSLGSPEAPPSPSIRGPDDQQLTAIRTRFEEVRDREIETTPKLDVADPAAPITDLSALETVLRGDTFSAQQVLERQSARELAGRLIRAVERDRATLTQILGELEPAGTSSAGQRRPVRAMVARVRLLDFILWCRLERARTVAADRRRENFKRDFEENKVHETTTSMLGRLEFLMSSSQLALPADGGHHLKAALQAALDALPDAETELVRPEDLAAVVIALFELAYRLHRDARAAKALQLGVTAPWFVAQLGRKAPSNFWRAIADAWEGARTVDAALLDRAIAGLKGSPPPFELGKPLEAWLPMLVGLRAECKVRSP